MQTRASRFFFAAVVAANAALLLADLSRSASGASSPKMSDDRLPIYSYAVQSGDFKEAGPFLAALHERIPGSLWLCDITYGHQGLISRCTTPGIEGASEVITRVSCASSDADSNTVHLSTLDRGAYASVYIACRRDEPDDGF